MGVTGLWKLIEPCGTPVPVETLEGKILAIDISIWLHQVVKGFQDSKGSALANAHLLGLFHRLCKLLYYRVKPVFVFDGCTPQLKRDTIARRQQQRGKLNTEADRIQAILLQSLAKEKVVQQALGANAVDILKSPLKRGSKAGRATGKDPDDMFKLPELPGSSSLKTGADTSQTDSSFCSATDEYESATADEDSSFDESNPSYAYNTNLQAIDVKSRHFLDLPADVRHEILVDIKETRKQSSWGRLHELPSRSDEFSTFQMKRLLKRRAVQEGLEKAEQEMGGRTLTYTELQNFFTEEGIVEPSVMEKGSKQISSDENTRYLLVRDLKKKLAKVKEEEETTTKEELKVEEVAKAEDPKLEDDQKPSTSSAAKELGVEYDTDMATAIAMSLENPNDPTAAVYREEDYEYEGGGSLRLNSEQRKQLQNAAKGPARAYMIEYGGMNDDEVGGIMETTQRHDADSDDDDVMLKLAIAESLKCQAVEKESSKSPVEEMITLRVSDSENDSDLEPVKENNEVTVIEDSEELKLRFSDDSDADSDLEEVVMVNEDKTPEKKPNALEIVLDLKETLKVEDDLFADIFEEKVTVEPNGPNASVKKPLDVESKKTTPLVTETPEIKSILNDLKQQVHDVKNITLDDVQLDLTNKVPIKGEIIEIYDSDTEPKKSPSASAKSPSKSPKLKTPSKNKTISEFFQTDYVIKRTPDKSTNENQETPKVTSPFFVKRTPSSAKKSTDKLDDSRTASPQSTKKRSKASKSLFENGEQATTVVELDDGEPLAKKSPPISTEDLITEAADVLRSQRTTAELSTMATELARERSELEAERNRQDRMGMSISQRMNVDCQELLRLFGIPYIVAPMEAEAQCAFLDAVELTNGTITDDSDIWLFGGRTVYKNFFAQNKHVLEYRANEIKKSFNCDRPKLIQLACLVGSDYTTGIHGIGAVTALEILASFNANTQDSLETEHQNIANVLLGLQKFRDWWLLNKNAGNSVPGSSARLALRKKLKNIELHEGFPNSAVIEAYLTPKVDDSRDAFTWGHPDVESIREFARKSFGWTSSKTDNILDPVMKKLNDKRTQATIRNYFTTKSAVSMRDIKVSKRVQKAIDKLSGKADAETPEKPAPRRARGKRKTAADAVVNEEPEEASEQLSRTEEVTTVGSSVAIPEKRPKRGVRIPDTKEVIPQREKDLAQMAENKARAAAVLKKAAATKATKRSSVRTKKT